MRNIPQDERFCKTSGLKENNFIDFIDLLNKSDFWPTHRAFAQKIALKLSQLAHKSETNERKNFIKRGERMAACAYHLGVEFCPDCGKYHVKRAQLCRDRACPTCGALRAAKLATKTAARMEASAGRFLHVMLTVPNCADGELKQNIRALSEGYTKLMKHKRLRGVVGGYVRTLEVTRPEDTLDPSRPWHPHLHAIWRVEDSYFDSPLYIYHEELLRLWNVIMGTAGKKPDGSEDLIKVCWIKPCDSEGRDKRAGAYEICQYVTRFKCVYNLTLEQFREWLGALKGARLWTAGGCLRVDESEVEINSCELEEPAAETPKDSLCDECGSHLQYADVAATGDGGAYKMLHFLIDWDARKKYNKLKHRRDREEARQLAEIRKKRSVPNDN